MVIQTEWLKRLVIMWPMSHSPQPTAQNLVLWKHHLKLTKMLLLPPTPFQQFSSLIFFEESSLNKKYSREWEMVERSEEGRVVPQSPLGWEGSRLFEKALSEKIQKGFNSPNLLYDPNPSMIQTPWPQSSTDCTKLGALKTPLETTPRCFFYHQLHSNNFHL